MADTWGLKAVLSMVDKMSPVLKNINVAAAGTRKHLLDVAQSANALTSKVGLPLTALSGMIGGFSAVKIKDAVVAFADMGEEIQKGALRAGMSVQQYQRMKYVAEQSGVAMEGMETSLGKLNKNLGETAAGKNKNLAGLFGRLHLSVRDANGQIKSAIDLLPALADAFQRNENPALRARMGRALFGNGYAEILPLLANGSKEIAKNIERFNKIKGVLGPEEIQGAKDLGESFKDLNLVMKGFQMAVAKELAPVIKPLVDDLTAWWVVNRKLVSAEVSKMAKDFGAWIKSIDFHQVLGDANAFVGSVRSLVQSVGGAKNALIGLVVIMNLQTISAFFGLIGATGRLILWIGRLSLTAIPAAMKWLGLYAVETDVVTTSTTALATATTVAEVRMAKLAATFKTVLAIAKPLSMALAPLAAIWGVSQWAQDTSHDKQRVEGIRNNAEKPLKSFLGWFGFDKDAEIAERYRKNRAELGGEDVPSARPSLIQAPQQQVGGKFVFDFQNAPPGMRLMESQTKGNSDFDFNMGWRSFAVR